MEKAKSVLRLQDSDMREGYLNNICESDISTVDGVNRNPSWTGMLFECLCIRDLKIYSQALGVKIIPTGCLKN